MRKGDIRGYKEIGIAFDLRLAFVTELTRGLY